LIKIKKNLSDFKTTHSRDPNGRYVVRLPFKETPSLMEGYYSTNY